MRSSFEDLVETSPSVKTDFQSDKRFELQNILNTRTLHLMRMRMTSAFSVYSACIQIRKKMGNPAYGDDCGEMGKQLR
jgi:hypothetical protein